MKNMLLQRFLPRVLRGFFPIATLLLANLSAAREIKIEFLPPPMEGTISMGVYDKNGKLVRILHREADLDEFKIALNGLVTQWDGRDDTGEECPGGKYRIRGYRVGELKIEGIEFHGNDWAADDDGPRLAAVLRIAALPDGTLLLEGTLPGSESPQRFTFAPAPGKPADETASKPSEATDEEWIVKPAPDTAFPEETGTAHWSWKVETIPAAEGSPEERVLHVRSADGARDFSIPLVNKGEHPVVTVARDRLYLLEEDAQGQELRGFELPAATPAEGTDAPVVTSPKQLFSRMILWSKTFEQVRERLKFPDGTPFEAQSTLRITLVNNPLTNKKRPALTLKLATDAEGASLTTDDGLPLARVSETPHLQWAVMGRPAKGNSVVIFESDGAAIEEYRATQLSQMMAFDAGLFTLKGSKKPEAAPSPTPEASPSKKEEDKSDPSAQEEKPVNAAAPAESPQPSPATENPANSDEAPPTTTGDE